MLTRRGAFMAEMFSLTTLHLVQNRFLGAIVGALIRIKFVKVRDSVDEKKMTSWFDDPSFDDMVEVVDGKKFMGNDWRRLMSIMEETNKVRVVPVAGITFHQDSLKIAMKGPPSLALVPEPENQHDSNAIRVEIGGNHVGYVPRGKNVSPDSRAHVCKWSMDPPHVWLAVEC